MLLSGRSQSSKRLRPAKLESTCKFPPPLPMFFFSGNKKSTAGGGANTFYGKPGVMFCTQQKTVTASWKRNETLDSGVNTNMPTLS